MEREERGSRKHVLDLLTSGSHEQLNTVLAAVRAAVRPDHRFAPKGYSDTTELDLRAFSKSCAREVDLTPLGSWWASEEYKGPTWDLLSECAVSDRPGYLLVEAKAHESELQRAGKRADEGASAQSQDNHRRIAESLSRSARWYKQAVHPSCTVTITSHYQLANRLSAAEVLASCGVPVILLYLGFTGDTYFTDHFRDADHWQRVMGAYIDGVVPLGWPGTTTPRDSRGGSVTMLIKSLPVREVSRRTERHGTR